jgi:aminoglycoside phosphotransferase (APT) family kinase protein
MSEHRWRRPPSRPALVGLLNKLAPGSKLLGISRLKGGLEAGMFSVLYLDALGSQERLVVRQTSDRDEGSADRAKREFATMSLLRDAGVPVPAPMLLDAEGNLLGTPSIVMSYAGEVVMQPDDRAEWLQGLSQAMRKLHSVTPTRFDLSHLQRFDREAVAEEIGEGLRPKSGSDNIARQALNALSKHLSRVEWLDPCLLHMDFWPANVLWQAGRVSAIIDWSPAKVGDRRLDVAQCRIEVMLLYGLSAAQELLDAYEAELGGRLSDLWFFDLFLGLRPLAQFQEWWLPAYVDLGLEISPAVADERMREFMTLALSRARDR